MDPNTTSNVETESWRMIPGTDGNYQASDLGRVRSTQPLGPGRRLGPDGVVASHPDRRGCPLVSMRTADGRPTKVAVAACVLRAFVEPRPTAGHLAAYLNGDPSDVTPSNLQWQTPLENHDVARDVGRVAEREVRIVNGRPSYLCRRCRMWQPVDRFYRQAQTYSRNGRPNSKCGRVSECPACDTERRVERRRLAKMNGGRSPAPADKAEPLLAELDRFALAADAGGLTPGGRLARARLWADLSRAELARRAGMKPATVDDVEGHGRIPRVATLRRLLRVFADG